MTLRPYATRTPPRTALTTAAAIVGVFGLACSSDSNTGFVGAPAIAVAAAGDATNNTVGLPIGPFVVKVTDTAGTPVTNVPVTFVASHGLTITPTSATTNEDGTAFTAGTFGNIAGVYTVTATVAGISTPLVFHTTAFADVPSVFTASGGNNQSGPCRNGAPRAAPGHGFRQVWQWDQRRERSHGRPRPARLPPCRLTPMPAAGPPRSYTLPATPRAFAGDGQRDGRAAPPLTATFTETGN